MVDERWKLAQKLGYDPFLILFLVEEKIIGYAPLVMRSKFGIRQVTNIDQYYYPEFFSDEYCEFCVDKTLDFIFNRLKCKLVELTFKDGSFNYRILESVCKSKRLGFVRVPKMGQAIIPVEGNYEDFESSLGGKERRDLRRLKRKLDEAGHWAICCVDFNNAAIDKIWSIERFSWKSTLQGRKKAIKNWGLELIIKGAMRNSEDNRFFESEVYFMNLNNEPIAYQIVLKRNKTAFCVKTSYDSRFRGASPGKILTYFIVEKMFGEKNIDKIDFLTNLSHMRNLNPIVNERVALRIEKDPMISKILRTFSENRVSSSSFRFFEDLKWNKISNKLFSF